MTINSVAGWSLIIAVILGFVSTLFTPGALIDPVNASNFGDAAEVLGNNSELAQFVTLLFVAAIVLYWLGLHSLHRAFRGGSVMDWVSRFALNIFLLGYALLIIELSIRHIMIHVLAHGVGGAAAEERAMATTLFTAAMGVHFAFLYVASIGSAIVGYSLARRCAGMSIFKLAALGMALTGIFSFIVLMIAEFVPAIDMHGIAVAGASVLLFGSLSILIIGVGIIQGRQEFVGEEAAT